MKLTTLVATTSAFLFAAFLAVGCSQQGPAERAGSQIDDAAEDVRNAAEDAADAVQDTAEDAVDAVEDAADDVQRNLEGSTN